MSPPLQISRTVAAWIAGLVEPADAGLATGAEESQEPSKRQVLDSLEFTGETAERQRQDELLGTFLTTAAVTRALSPEPR
jgi:hypothetical protein